MPRETVTISQVGPEKLTEYATVPIVATASSIFDVHEKNGVEIELREQSIDGQIHKDYDKLPEGGPLDWARSFDLNRWNFWLARDRDTLVGAAAVACHSPSIHLLAGRSDTAALWDIRVHPAAQRRGVGRTLFDTAANWAKSQGCRLLIVETQNVNVAACKFYRAMGCKLRQLDRHAYRQHPEIANEIQLIWELKLDQL
jgi:GNAT superfamily N-acetyltransferase